MTRIAPTSVWPDGTAPAKGDIRQWAGEVDARLVFQSRGALEAASITGAGSAVHAVAVAGRTQGGDLERLTLFAYRETEPSSGVYVQSADGAYWLLESRGFHPRDYGAAGDGSTNDSAAWAAMITHLIARATAAGALVDGQIGGGRYGGVIDLEGRSYVLGSAHQIAAPVTIRNGRILFAQAALAGDWGLCLGVDADTGNNYGHVVEDVEFGLSGTLSANVPAALLAVPRTLGTVLRNVNVHAGGGAYRARYGVYLGRRRAWGCTIMHGRYFGGECCLRIGRENDHTSNNIQPAACDHGRVVNMLLCNPAGTFVKADMEHSDGKTNIAITSRTNNATPVHAAHAVRIVAGYQFNLSDPGPGLGWNPDVTGILIGHDVPGTEGWDQVGVITSADTAEQITIENLYCVSNQMPTVVKARILSGLKIEHVKWYARGGVAVTGVSGTFTAGETVTGGTSNATAVFRALEDGVLLFDSCVGDFDDDETITGESSAATATTDTATAYKRDRLLELSGAGANVRIGSVRNQNTGSIAPSITSTATNPVMVDQPLQRTFQPVLRGDSTAGAFTYSTRGGLSQVTAGLAHVTGWLNWTAIDTSPVGDMEITLPPIVSRAPAGSRAAVTIQTAGMTYACDAILLDPADAVFLLYRAGTTTRIAAADLGSTGSAHFTLAFPALFEDAA